MACVSLIEASQCPRPVWLFPASVESGSGPGSEYDMGATRTETLTTRSGTWEYTVYKYGYVGVLGPGTVRCLARMQPSMFVGCMRGKQPASGARAAGTGVCTNGYHCRDLPQIITSRACPGIETSLSSLVPATFFLSSFSVSLPCTDGARREAAPLAH